MASFELCKPDVEQSGSTALISVIAVPCLAGPSHAMCQYLLMEVLGGLR